MCKENSSAARVGSDRTDGAAVVSSEKPREASLLARYFCLSVMVGIFGVWAKLTFVPEDEIPGVGETPLHSAFVTLALTAGYLISLPILRWVVENLLKGVDMKSLLFESMVMYNVAQVVLNAYMVYKMVYAVMYNNHPFIGNTTVTDTGATYAVWVHYCDKYLEFFDTYFMVLRGKMNQVSFLHVYHHATIAWAWWIALRVFPGGDAYFGALFNSWIHVLMYSYYAMSLLKMKCPWKRYLTQAQLFQFASVVGYTAVGIVRWPNKDWRHYTAAVTQVGEMVSLFVLFSHFYRKSYAQKKLAGKDAGTTSSSKKSDDQCEQAVAQITTGTTIMMEAAAKDANKIMNSAKKTLIAPGSRTANAAVKAS